MARALRRRAVRLRLPIGIVTLRTLRGLSLLLLLVQPAAAVAQEPVQVDPLEYAVLYADESGVTHFRDEVIPFSSSGTGRPGVWSTAYQEATDIGFLRVTRDYPNEWHPAPRKQFVMTLHGIVEIEAGDGETRRFAPGEAVLVTDTEGPGHRTRVVGNTDVLAVWVPVP